MEEQFATLRELLTQDPSDEAWAAIKACLNLWPADSVQSVAIDYLRSHMVSWPDEYQEALARWAPVRWDAKGKRRAYVRRGSPRNPKSLRKPKPMTVAAYRAHWREKVVRYAASFSRTSGDLGDDVLARIAQVEEAFAEGVEVSLSADVEAYTWALLRRLDVKLSGKQGDIVSHWYQVSGLSFAINTLCNLRGECLPLRFPYSTDSDYTCLFIEEELEAFVTLRRLLATASDDEFAAALATAETRWEGADMCTQGMLAFCFPGQRGWGDLVLQAWMVSSNNAYQRPQLLVMAILGATSNEARLVVATSIQKYYCHTKLLYSMVDVLGSDALELLKTLYEKDTWNYAKALAEALAMIESPAVATVFAEHLDVWKEAPDAETAFLKAHPDWAKAALQDAIDAKQTKEHPMPRAEALLEVLEADDKLLVKEIHEEGAFVDPASLPRGIGAPPWRVETPKAKKKAKKGKAKALAMLPYEPAFVMPAEERTSFMESRAEDELRHDCSPAKDQEQIERWWAVAQEENSFYWISPEYLTVAGCHALLKTFPLEVVLQKFAHYYGLIQLLVPLTDPGHETPDLAAFFAYVRAWDKKNIGGICGHIDDALLAPTIAEMATTKTLRNGAVAWLAKFPKAAATGLIPAIANTRGKKKKETYQAALQLAMEKGDRAVVEAVAAAYGGDEAGGGSALDAYEIYPKKMPKMPAFWSPSAYPPLRLRDDPTCRLPMEVIEDVGLMLKFSGNTPYIGLHELKEVVDPIALDRWSWALFASWVKAGCNMKEIWPLSALAFLGQGTMCQELPLLMDQWYSTGHHQRGWRLMDILQEFATPWCVMALELLRKSGLHPYVGGDVWGRLSNIDESVDGCDTIVDQTTPTLGWTHEAGPTIACDDGTLLSVQLDPAFQPMLLDNQGTVLYDWPDTHSPGRVAWEALQHQSAWLAAHLMRRLELSMRGAISWPLERWQADWCGHPLLGRLCKGLVWGSYEMESDTTPKRLFSVAEDGSFRNNVGNKSKIPKEEFIRLPHPLSMEPHILDTWREAFAAAGIEQPLPQLHRPIFSLTEKEHEEDRLLRFHGKQMPLYHCAVLGRGGWACDKRAWDQINRLVLSLPNKTGKKNKLQATLLFQPGFSVKEYLVGGHLTISEIYCPRGSWGYQDPMWISELLYDLGRICVAA